MKSSKTEFFAILIISFSSIFVLFNEYDVLAFEENVLPLQTGIISTVNQDYAISQEFDTKIFQNGKIIRLSGITTTGEQYYVYQKNIDGEIIIRGKIFVNDVFMPIIFNQDLIEQPTIQSESKLTMAVKLSKYTYSGYPFVISVKVFDNEINSNPRYDSKIGIVEDVLVNVKISDESGRHITTLSGNTGPTGVFQDNYLVKEEVVKQGEYTVEVTVDNGISKTSKLFSTFFRGDIRDYFHDTN